MNHTKSPQVIAIASGKGGAGKSTLSINLSMALADLGKRVALLDANLELPDIATLLNILPDYTITDLIEGRRSISEIIHHGAKGILFILGKNLPKPMRNLSSAHHFGLVNAFNGLSKKVDTLIIDTAPGINTSTLNFIRASQEILLITHNEPTAIASTNALINTLYRDYNVRKFRIFINKVLNAPEGQKAFNRIYNSNKNTLDLLLNYAGCAHESPSAREAALKHEALYDMLPRSEFAQDIKRLAHAINTWPIRETPTGQIEFFMEALIKQ